VATLEESIAQWTSLGLTVPNTELAVWIDTSDPADRTGDAQDTGPFTPEHEQKQLE
jgi:hypothetical protein